MTFGFLTMIALEKLKPIMEVPVMAGNATAQPPALLSSRHALRCRRPPTEADGAAPEIRLLSLTQHLTSSRSVQLPHPYLLSPHFTLTHGIETKSSILH